MKISPITFASKFILERPLTEMETKKTRTELGQIGERHGRKITATHAYSNDSDRPPHYRTRDGFETSLYPSRIQTIQCSKDMDPHVETHLGRLGVAFTTQPTKDTEWYLSPG
jgi:hypothetical protein